MSPTFKFSLSGLLNSMSLSYYRGIVNINTFIASRKIGLPNYTRVPALKVSYVMILVLIAFSASISDVVYALYTISSVPEYSFIMMRDTVGGFLKAGRC